MGTIDEQVQEAEQLDREATVGPWEATYGYNNGGCATGFFKIPGHTEGADVEMLVGDAFFCARARKLLPALATEVRRLTAALDGRAAVEHNPDGYDER